MIGGDGDVLGRRAEWTKGARTTRILLKEFRNECLSVFQMKRLFSQLKGNKELNERCLKLEVHLEAGLSFECVHRKPHLSSKFNSLIFPLSLLYSLIFNSKLCTQLRSSISNRSLQVAILE